MTACNNLALTWLQIQDQTHTGARVSRIACHLMTWHSTQYSNLQSHGRGSEQIFLLQIEHHSA